MFPVRRSLPLLVAVGFVLTETGPIQAEPGSSPTEEKSPLVEFKPVRVLKFEGKPYRVLFSRDGSVLAVSYTLGHIRIWNTQSWKEIDTTAINKEKEKTPDAVAISPDGRILVCERPGYDDLCLFEIATEKLLWTLGYDGRRHLWGHTFSPDGKALATATLKDGIQDIKIWDVQTGKEISCITGLFPAWKSICLAFSPDGKVLAAAPKGEAVHMFDVKSGKELRRHKIGRSENDIAGVAFSPDGRFFAAGTHDQPPVKVWGARDGKPVWELRWPLRPDWRLKKNLKDLKNEKMRSLPGEPAEHPPGIVTLAFSSDGRALVSVGYDRWIRVWEMATGQPRFRFEPFRNKYPSQAFAIGGRFLAAVDGEAESREVSVWDLRTGPPVASPAVPLDADKAWAELRGPDAARAYERIRGLAAVSKEATFLLDKRLPSAEPVKAAVIEGLIKELDAHDFDVRERAAKRLSDLGEVAGPALERARAATPSAEMGKRLKELLDALSAPPVGDRLAYVRAVEVLETIGSPEARRVLKRLAAGAPSALLTREAKAALARVKSP